MCLPEKIQHDILHHAFFPSDLGANALVMGKPSHEAHLKDTVIPVLLGQGNWQAYIDAARILYYQVHLVLFRYPDAAMHFLTSPTTLRLRNLVCKLQIRMDIENDLCLFDEGWRSTASIPEARVNVSTALHSMQIHGRLCEVHFLINMPEVIYQPESDVDSAMVSKCVVPSYYLPMARLQLAHRDLHFGQPSIPNATLAAHPGQEVIAPAFLAGRAFQYGFLPLLKECVVWKSDLSVEVVLEDDESQVEDMDAARIFRCWLGATILEVLGNHTARQTAQDDWVNPFMIRRHATDGNEACMLQRCNEGGAKAPTAMLADDDDYYDMLETNHPEVEAQYRSTPFPRAPERPGYKSRGDDLVDDSPTNYGTSGTNSRSSSVTSAEDATIDLETQTQVNVVEYEVVNDGALVQTRDEGNVCHAGGSDTDEVFNSCLEIHVSRKVMGENLDSVEGSPMFGKISENLESPSSCEDDVAHCETERGKPVPSKAIGGLDCANTVVAEAVREECPAPINHILHEAMECSSSSESGGNSSEDECPPSSNAAFKTARTVLREDTTATALIATQGSGGDQPASDLSAPILSTNCDSHALAAAPVEGASGLSKYDSSSINTLRGQDSDSLSSDDNSDSDSDSASLTARVAKDHSGTSNIISQIISSPRAQSSSSSDSDDESDSSPSEDERESSARKSAQEQQSIGNFTNRQRETIVSKSKWSADKKVSTACPQKGDKTLLANTSKGTIIGQVSTNSQTAYTPPPDPTQAVSQQVSQGPSQGKDTTSLKRKTSHEGLDQAKKSKKARWRANRRARLLARTAAEE